MPIEVLMPALSPTMEKGNLAKWLKKEGDAVKSGDVIAEIETDKATMEVEAVDEGTLGKILVPEGTNDVAVNTPIAMILAEGEDAASLKSAKPSPRKPQSDPATDAAGRGIPLARRGARRDQGAAGRAEAVGAGRARSAGRHRNGDHDRPRSLARRHGRGDAPRPQRVRDGRGSRRVPGRLQGDPGPAAGVRRDARDRHADHRARLCRRRRRRGDGRAQADGRVHDLQLRHAGHGPAHQFGGQDALHVGRPDDDVGGVPRAERAGGARRRPAQPGFHRLVLAHSGPQGDRALHRRRRQGPAQVGDPRSQPRHLPRKRNSLRAKLPGPEARRLSRSRSARRRSRAAATT